MSISSPIIANIQVKDGINYRRPGFFEAGTVQLFFQTILDTSFPMISLEGLQAYKKSWTEQSLKTRIQLNADLLFLAWDGSMPIGLVSGPSPEGGVGTIIWMLVSENYRNKKIGKHLLLHACQFYQHLGCHKLKLTAPSERAKEFYLKQGMILEGFHPNHWWKTDFWSLSKII